MQTRYYNRVVGRFLSNDPVGFAEGGVDYFNRYSYTANNPVNAIDPDGEFINFIAGAIVGVAVAAIDAGVQQVTTGKVDIGQSLRAGTFAGASTALGPIGGSIVAGAGSALEAGIASQQRGDSTARVLGNAVIGGTIGAAVNAATGGFGNRATSGLAVKELLGQAPSGSATVAQMTISGVSSQGLATVGTKSGTELGNAAADTVGSAITGAPEAMGTFLNEISNSENFTNQQPFFEPDELQ